MLCQRNLTQPGKQGSARTCKYGVKDTKTRKGEHYSRGIYIYIYLSRSNFVSLFQYPCIRNRNTICRHWRSSSTKSPDDVTYRCCSRQNGSPLVAPGHRYKNSHNFVISDQTCLKLFIRALSITIYFSSCISTGGCLCL